MIAKVIVDTSYLIALLDEKDVHHTAAAAIHHNFSQTETLYIYLDCVINETATVLVRRAIERKMDPVAALKRLRREIPPDVIDWTGSEWHRLWDTILDFMSEHRGKLSFVDSLIVVAAMEAGIRKLVSFDEDFDTVKSLVRIFKPEQLVK